MTTSMLFACVQIATQCLINRSVSLVLIDDIGARLLELFLFQPDLNPADIPSFHSLCAVWLRLMKIVAARILFKA